MKHSQHQLIRLYLDNLQVNVTAMGYNQVWTDWRDLDYTPDYNKFYMICDGEGWLKIRESEYLPQPGQWFLMPQGVKQSYSLTDGPRFRKYWCHFTARIGESNLFDLLMVPCYIDTYGDAEPVRLFRELLSCETSDALTSPLLLKAAMYNLIAYFLEHAYGTEAGIHPAAVSEPLKASFLSGLTESAELGEVAVLKAQFNNGADWTFHVLYHDTPVLQNAEGTTANFAIPTAFNGDRLATMEAVYAAGGNAGPHNWTSFKEFARTFKPTYAAPSSSTRLRRTARASRAQHRRARIDRFGIKGVLPCAPALGQDSFAAGSSNGYPRDEIKAIITSIRMPSFTLWHHSDSLICLSEN